MYLHAVQGVLIVISIFSSVIIIAICTPSPLAPERMCRFLPNLVVVRLMIIMGVSTTTLCLYVAAVYIPMVLHLRELIKYLE